MDEDTYFRKNMPAHPLKPYEKIVNVYRTLRISTTIIYIKNRIEYIDENFLKTMKLFFNKIIIKYSRVRFF